jgi:tetratricopeptide (TPR) repeat protein
MHITIINGSIQGVVRLIRSLFSAGIFLAFLLLVSCTLQRAGNQWDPLREPDVNTAAIAEPGLSRSDKRLSPAMADLLQQADWAIERQGWAEASGLLERALRINPRQAQAWSRMAVVKLGAGNAQQGIQMAKKSNRFAQGDKQIKAYNWLLISRGHEQLGQTVQARQALERSRRIQGGLE